MKPIYTLLFLLLSLCVKAQTETEPNNTFETSEKINISVARTGTVNDTNDGFDYFFAVLPTDGSVKVFIQATNTSNAAGYLYMTGYDKRKAAGTTFGEYIATTSTSAGASIADTITAKGVAADTFYFRLQATRTFSYSFRYEIEETSTNDVEPNGSFAQAVSLASNEEKMGHIEYFNGTTDQYDYYKTKLPVDGTLRVFVKGTNNGSAAGYLYLYGYDKRKAAGTSISAYIVSTSTPAGATIIDTLLLKGAAADSFFFRLEASRAFSYTLRYEMVDTSLNDIEQNNTFEQAIPIAHKEEKKGHVEYFNGTSDQYDYYKTLLPVDGTLKVYIKATNTGSAPGYLYVYGYDKRKASGTRISAYINSTSTPAGVTIMDTLILKGVAADSFHFRLEASRAFAYSIRYEMADTSLNDAEPNATFEQAITIEHQQERTGHIGYVNGTEDQYDYYKTLLPSDGTMKVYVKGTNMGSTAGYLYLYGYDRRKASGTLISEYIAGTSTPAGATIFDTLTLQCAAADSFFYRLQATQAFTYSIKYEVTLGRDTMVKVCPGFTTNIAGLYNTSPFSTVKYENLANAGVAISPLSVGGGIYRLSVYNGTECTRDTAIITVALNPKPNLGADTTIRKCVGSTANISTAKNTIGYALVEWSTATPAAVAVGTYTLVVTNEFGCKDTAVILVENYPQPVAGFIINTQIQCVKGNNFAFTNASAISAGTYTNLWSFGDNTTSTLTSPAKTYAAPGTYTVKLVITSNNGCKDSIVQTVTVNSNPDLSADKAITISCAGGTADITGLYNTAAFASFTYSTATPATTAAGVYSLIVTALNGCKDTAVITVAPSPGTIVAANGAITKLATRECTDALGWTHYYNDNATPADFADDILLLSLKKNGNNIGTAGLGSFQVKVAATAGAGSNTGVAITNPLNQNASGFWAFNRFWEVTTTSQPTSPVGVRFYYTTQDLNDVNGSNPGHTHQQLVFYKLAGGNPDPTFNFSAAQRVTSIVNGSVADTGTYTYHNVNATTHYAEFAVNRFSGGSAGVSGNNLPLPLNLVNFTAKLQTQNVQLVWNTAQELNTSHFNIQRSTDGASFNNVGKTPAKGLNAAAYAFNDANATALGSTKLYYRLQIVDKDNKVSYSPIVTVQLQNNQLFTVWPNPAKNVVYVKGGGIQQVQIINNTGQLVQSEKVNNQGVNEVNISQLSKGIYMVKVLKTDGTIHVQKLIIQ